ncbi:hypothetical protein DVH24_022962 [Malus domestica]|uniref:Uncharacterized protein n=1 Tax=Malus domestica TaxID=3750 RepID=A0A498KM35_MALDO|nr:hypothetical protein DVH24_022962 [Malus domestica]
MHAPISPREEAHHPSSPRPALSLSLPLVPATPENRKRSSGEIFQSPDEIEAGCKHTQLRRPRGFFRPSPAIPRRKEGIEILPSSCSSFWYLDRSLGLCVEVGRSCEAPVVVLRTQRPSGRLCLGPVAHDPTQKPFKVFVYFIFCFRNLGPFGPCSVKGLKTLFLKTLKALFSPTQFKAQLTLTSDQLTVDLVNGQS